MRQNAGVRIDLVHSPVTSCENRWLDSQHGQKPRIRKGPDGSVWSPARAFGNDA